MTRDRVFLGSAPSDEDCAQVGDPDYRDRSIRECRHYIEAIKKVCGEPPEGAVLRVVSENHDYGVYREVACEFDSENDAAGEYAFMCERKAPETWAEAGMVAPIAQRGRER